MKIAPIYSSTSNMPDLRTETMVAIWGLPFVELIQEELYWARCGYHGGLIDGGPHIGVLAWGGLAKPIEHFSASCDAVSHVERIARRLDAEGKSGYAASLHSLALHLGGRIQDAGFSHWRNVRTGETADQLEGYDPSNYFDEDGAYLGPDEHGWEPVFGPT